MSTNHNDSGKLEQRVGNQRTNRRDWIKAGAIITLGALGFGGWFVYKAGQDLIKLKPEIRPYAVSTGTSEHRQEEVRQLFRQYDLNRDGVIEPAEYSSVLQQRYSSSRQQRECTEDFMNAFAPHPLGCP